MKIRTDFVTNSSSSSFITARIDGREAKDWIDIDSGGDGFETAELDDCVKDLEAAKTPREVADIVKRALRIERLDDLDPEGSYEAFLQTVRSAESLSGLGRMELVAEYEFDEEDSYHKELEFDFRFGSGSFKCEGSSLCDDDDDDEFDDASDLKLDSSILTARETGMPESVARLSAGQTASEPSPNLDALSYDTYDAKGDVSRAISKGDRDALERGAIISLANVMLLDAGLRDEVLDAFDARLEALAKTNGVDGYELLGDRARVNLSSLDGLKALLKDVNLYSAKYPQVEISGWAEYHDAGLTPGLSGVGTKCDFWSIAGIPGLGRRTTSVKPGHYWESRPHSSTKSDVSTRTVKWVDGIFATMVDKGLIVCEVEERQSSETIVLEEGEAVLLSVNIDGRETEAEEGSKVFEIPVETIAGTTLGRLKASPMDAKTIALNITRVEAFVASVSPLAVEVNAVAAEKQPRLGSVAFAFKARNPFTSSKRYSTKNEFLAKRMERDSGNSVTPRKSDLTGSGTGNGLDEESPSNIRKMKRVWKVEKKLGSYVLNSWWGDSTIAEVPDHIGKFRITAIGDRAFSPFAGGPNKEVLEKRLEEVYLPEGVLSIGYLCFYRCEALRSVHFSNGIQSVGGHAFDGCKSLKMIDLPSTVSSIWGGAFCNMELLRLTIRTTGSLFVEPTHPRHSPLSVEEFRFCSTQTCDAFFESYNWSLAKRVLFHASIPEDQREAYIKRKSEFIERMAIYSPKYHPVEFGTWED